ncbi:MAG: AraC family transcriptional regulator [Gammaproteobacteria bacterium]|nr:AraC family transcriptional regulator [Gammaproteobacteria bacterium]
MPSSTPNSIIASWVLLIARTIDDCGHDSRALFRQAGLDYSHLNEPGARYSYTAVYRLWELAAASIPDPCLGMRVASLWHPTTIHALGYSWMASYNLDEAYRRIVRFGRFLNSATNAVLKIHESEHAYGLLLGTSVLNHEAPQVGQEAGLALILNMSHAAYGTGFRPVSVSVRRALPDCVDRFCGFFDAPVDFLQDRNAIWFDPAQVQEPLATANPELVRINDQIVIDYLARMDSNDVVTRVRSKITERLPTGRIDEAEIASAINLSQRSLQRRLGEQDLSFVRLLENTRRDLSREYVRDPQRSINEVAYLLGFTEPGNFSRAFKRWYGKTPSEYRG